MSSAFILSGSPASPIVLRSGTSVIPAASKVIAVADTAITASSVVVCWGVGAQDATALSLNVDVLVAGTGFSIVSEAVAAANKTVGWAVLKY